jgi:hypothetical protein
LTGDNQATTARIEAEVGLDPVLAEVPPGQTAKVKELHATRQCLVARNRPEPAPEPPLSSRPQHGRVPDRDRPGQQILSRS